MAFTTRVDIKLSHADSTIIQCPADLIINERELLLKVRAVTYRVYGKGDREFNGLSIPLLRSKLHGGLNRPKMVQPWFGPYRWEGIYVPGGSSVLEPRGMWELSISFTNGGMLEFKTLFEKFSRQIEDTESAAPAYEGEEDPLPAYSP